MITTQGSPFSLLKLIGKKDENLCQKDKQLRRQKISVCYLDNS